mmetsp:Transcript_26034/g.42709  ORF Transcript_26034/g.42709 Transcript_26034/m.42709 type:complete len:109 (-) Transcript_26034:132-458(-)
MLDDLRDYRFYEDDMLHPSGLARAYIWEKLVGAFMHKNSLLLMNRIARITQAAEHKPFNPMSRQHQSFVQKQLQEIRILEAQYPWLDFSEERRSFTGGLRETDTSLVL